MALDFAAGCLGGCAGVLVGHPFDTVKVHLQTQDFRNPKYSGTFHCMKTIIVKEGIRGIYRGITSPMGGIAFVNAIVFGVYGNTQRRLEDPNSIKAHCIAGSIAGLAQSVVCSPMELAKTRMQLQPGNNQLYTGPIDCLLKIRQTHGIRNVFRGLGVTAARDVPGLASYFVAYEVLTRNHNPTVFQTLMSGGLAGTISWVVSFPFDVVKSRLQADGMHGPQKYNNAMDCARKSYNEEGYRFFTRGLNSTLMRAFPMNAACFLVVSWVLKYCNNSDLNLEIRKPESLHVVGTLSIPVLAPIKHHDQIKLRINHTARSLIFLGALNEAVCESEIIDMTYHEDTSIETNENHYYHLNLSAADKAINPEDTNNSFLQVT